MLTTTSSFTNRFLEQCIATSTLSFIRRPILLELNNAEILIISSPSIIHKPFDRNKLHENPSHNAVFPSQFYKVLFDPGFVLKESPMSLPCNAGFTWKMKGLLKKKTILLPSLFRTAEYNLKSWLKKLFEQCLFRRKKESTQNFATHKVP